MFKNHFNADRVATIIGVDPGTQKMGICCLQYDVIDLTLLQVNYELCKSNQLYIDPWEAAQRGETQVKISAICQYFHNLLIRVNPQSVVYETPYISLSTPNAFAPLSQLQFGIQQTVYQFDHQLPFYTIQPSLVKTSIGAKGGAGKEDVLAAFSNFKPLHPFLRENPFEMDNNVIDAICVAHAQFCIYRDSRMMHC